jgi:3-deoxy-manno-octulosonate cytidylyltransferase (CMP-KDO synthetase)
VAAALPPDQIFVATDDDRIRRACEDERIRVVMTSSSCPTGTDRVSEAAQQINSSLIVNVQGDEPLIQPGDILAVIEAKRAFPRHVVNAMCPIRDPAHIESPNVPKVVLNERSELVYMSRAAVPYVRNRTTAVHHYRQVCIYGFDRVQLNAFAAHGRKSTLEEPEDIEILRFLDLGIPVRMVTVSDVPVAVDVPEDIARVERLLDQDSGI